MYINLMFKVLDEHHGYYEWMYDIKLQEGIWDTSIYEPLMETIQAKLSELISTDKVSTVEFTVTQRAHTKGHSNAPRARSKQ
mmetsp:Transcript_21245/g.36525  ORF Transcript_21245/g.36525 Transcript_21245/m.36525 type:complete len:82 (-) Transcript_21245:42-287(-)